MSSDLALASLQEQRSQLEQMLQKTDALLAKLTPPPAKHTFYVGDTVVPMLEKTQQVWGPIDRDTTFSLSVLVGATFRLCTPNWNVRSTRSITAADIASGCCLWASGGWWVYFIWVADDRYRLQFVEYDP